MGYRSEVILAVGPEVMPQFMVTMAKSPEARKMCFAEADTMIKDYCCLLYTSPSPRDISGSRMPSSA